MALSAECNTSFTIPRAENKEWYSTCMFLNSNVGEVKYHCTPGSCTMGAFSNCLGTRRSRQGDPPKLASPVSPDGILSYAVLDYGEKVLAYKRPLPIPGQLANFLPLLCIKTQNTKCGECWLPNKSKPHAT
ncbi:hypothetical protein O181_025201 [Austropuccinia psidii MF-1]|uniref:Uncharacterized protein n=1 Tax=Austropuccinia psidii MF-1 TaxID=1389203 RepID=A0A9Q3GZB8_9BASI|nr:hypothetical protein [Austropuccinia psidii MF-1]